MPTSPLTFDQASLVVSAEAEFLWHQKIGVHGAIRELEVEVREHESTTPLPYRQPGSRTP